MRRRVRSPVLLVPSLLLLLAACGDASRPTGPVAGSSLARQSAGGSERLVTMMDACDPTTFNAALGDPTACLRRGGVTFDRFLAQLETHGVAGAWRFAPPTMHVQVGETLVAINRGGEVHTFTEVEHFGGGIVAALNALSGNPVAAPECLQLGGDDFVPAGGTDREEVHEPGTELYQCCIHPWMRTTVHAHAHGA